MTYIRNPLAIAGSFVLMFACGYDLLTPDDQNIMASLIAIFGILIFILGELRLISASLRDED